MKKNSKVYELAKINNEKIASLPKAIYSFNDILLKIPMTFYRAKKKCSLLQTEAQRLPGLITLQSHRTTDRVCATSMEVNMYTDSEH